MSEFDQHPSMHEEPCGACRGAIVALLIITATIALVASSIGIIAIIRR